MLKSLSRPIVAVIGNNMTDQDSKPIIALRMQYLEALVTLCDVQPLIVPPLDPKYGVGFQHLIGSIDGVLLTGNISNIDPAQYGQEAANPLAMLDQDRDETVIPSIKYLVNMGVPLLAICRGMQEMNVAYGGSLHQNISDVEGHLYHRWYDDHLYEDNFSHRHNLKVQKGGTLEGILPLEEIYMVNSVHEQGIDRVGFGLKVEGLAEDGVIEAISVSNSPNFTLGVQWRPEWHRYLTQAPNKPIFTAFSKAVFAYHEKRIEHHVG